MTMMNETMMTMTEMMMMTIDLSMPTLWRIPTKFGEELIAAVTGGTTAPGREVPPFNPPPTKKKDEQDTQPAAQVRSPSCILHFRAGTGAPPLRFYPRLLPLPFIRVIRAICLIRDSHLTTCFLVKH